MAKKKAKKNTEKTQKTKRRTKRRVATAFHEAGHAVVYRSFRLICNEVSIIPGDGHRGYHSHATPIGYDGSTRERKQMARAMIVSCYAGLPAQRIVEPDAPDWHANVDEQNAFDLSREYLVMPRIMTYVGDDLHEKYLGKLKREAARLVRKYRPQIELLAEALLASPEGKLTGDEVNDILKGMTD